MQRAKAVIRRAVDLGRGRLLFLFGLAMLIALPLGLIDAVEEEVGGIDTDELRDLELLGSIAATAAHVASGLIGQIVYAGAVAVAVIETAPGRSPSLREVVERTRWMVLIAVDLLFALGMLVSLLLLVVPALFFYPRYALAAPVAEIEERGIRDSFARAAELSRGARLVVLGLLLSTSLAGDLISEVLKQAAGEIGTSRFIGDWLVAAGSGILLSPVTALLTVAIFLQLGGRPRRPAPGLRARAGS